MKRDHEDEAHDEIRFGAAPTAYRLWLCMTVVLGNVLYACRSRVLYGGASNSSKNLPPELEGDERLKNIEPKMVELITNEVFYAYTQTFICTYVPASSLCTILPTICQYSPLCASIFHCEPLSSTFCQYHPLCTSIIHHVPVSSIPVQIMDHGSPVQWEDIAGLDFAKASIKEIVVWPMLRP